MAGYQCTAESVNRFLTIFSVIGGIQACLLTWSDRREHPRARQSDRLRDERAMFVAATPSSSDCKPALNVWPLPMDQAVLYNQDCRSVKYGWGV